MGSFAVGAVVLVLFPYSDFSAFKKRPALVVSTAEFDNLILCQITSRAETSRQAIALSDGDFARGGLKINSFIRPDKIFTVEPSVVESQVGSLKPAKLKSVKTTLRRLFD